MVRASRNSIEISRSRALPQHEARIITRVHTARKSAGDRAPHPCARWTLRCAAGRIRLRAPVAQLDRVLVSEAKGHRFDSCRARQSDHCIAKTIIAFRGCGTSDAPGLSHATHQGETFML